MMSMSGGGYSYNRFDAYEQMLAEKKAKPDFLDMDKDGDKEESMKKAIKDKKKCKHCGGKGCDKCEDKKEDVKEEVIDEASGCGYQEGGEVKAKKKTKVVKEDVLEYILENDLANNEVSAEVLFNHISDAFLEEIEEEIMEGWKPLPKEKMARQADKAYDKEQAAVRAGNEKETNKQMQRRIAMKSPAGRKTQLGK